MRKPGLATVGFGLIGIGSSLFAAPASAAIDCGPTPSDGTLTQSGDYCQLVYSTPGNYNFTVPSNAGQLFALVVGAGSGAFAPGDFGYGGNGGQVKYSDLSSSINAPLTIVVGTRGATNPTGSETNAGGDSSVTSATQSGLALGGPAANGNRQCMFPPSNYAYLLSVGDGAGGIANTDPNNTNLTCSQSPGVSDLSGPGVNPRLGNRDSASTAVPAIFKNVNMMLGRGGTVRSYTYNHRSIGYGDGANVLVDLAAGTLAEGSDLYGGNGYIMLRWREGTGLANTGSNSSDLSSVAASLITLGAALTVASRMRRRTAKKH